MKGCMSSTMGRTSYLMLFGICILLITINLAAAVKNTEFKGSATRQRTRRALGTILSGLSTLKLKGLTAQVKLLKDLGKPMGRIGNTVIYRKSGGPQQMVEDFKSVNPTHIQRHKNPMIGPGLQGLVGDRVIYYGVSDGGNKGRLVVIKRPLDSTPMQEAKAIVYAAPLHDLISSDASIAPSVNGFEPRRISLEDICAKCGCCWWKWSNY